LHRFTFVEAVVVEIRSRLAASILCDFSDAAFFHGPVSSRGPIKVGFGILSAAPNGSFLTFSAHTEADQGRTAKGRFDPFATPSANDRYWAKVKFPKRY
jgi:hypothetical protein